MRRRRAKFGAVFAVTALAGVGLLAGALLGALSGPACTPITGSNFLEISDSALSPGTARVFCFEEPDGHRIRFILARDRQGIVHTALDACERCAMFHKGYDIVGNYLVCRVCGNRYRLSEMGVGKASCVPVNLGHREHGKQILINVAELKAAKALF